MDKVKTHINEIKNWIKLTKRNGVILVCILLHVMKYGQIYGLSRVQSVHFCTSQGAKQGHVYGKKRFEDKFGSFPTPLSAVMGQILKRNHHIFHLV